MSNTLIIFAKAPIVGQVKTRLCPPMTLEQAAGLATYFLIDTVERACSLPDVQVYVAFTPTDSESVFRALLSFPVHYVAQRGHSLGERELNVFRDLQQQEPRKVVLIGSDIPTLPRSHLQEAFTLLGDPGCNVVLNPTEDGGYCLIGMREPHAVLFENISWSTPAVLQETLAQAQRHNLKVKLLPSWYDVDEASDLHRLATDLSQPDRAAEAPRTREFLDRLGFSVSR
ncbi:MAG: glycosyltransferase [Deltaproteobacteria bacterium]|nr:glycosyltransferase [Deltaproteobacteria bacterium]